MASLRRWRDHEQLIVLCVSTFLVMVGQGVVAPVLPLYAEDFGVSTTMVGLTLTVFAAARLILNVPAGMLADRVGRRILLVGGPVITSIGMIGSGFADTIWSLLAWRFVAGAGSAFYMSGALIYLIDIARPDQRARYVAVNQWALSVGVAVGPGLGGLLAETYGLSVPFHVVGATAIATAVYGAVRLPETRRDAARSDDDADTPDFAVRSFVFGRAFLAVALVSMSIFMIRGGMRGVLVPLRADRALDWGPGEVGVVFTVTGLMTLFTLMPAAWAADRFGRAAVIVFSGVVAGLGGLVIAGGDTATAFVAGNVIMVLGTGTAGPAPAAYIADITPEHVRGLGVALYRSAGDVGFVAGPPLLGWLADETSIPVALRVASAIVATSALWFAFATRGQAAAGSQRARAGTGLRADAATGAGPARR